MAGCSNADKAAPLHASTTTKLTPDKCFPKMVSVIFAHSVHVDVCLENSMCDTSSFDQLVAVKDDYGEACSIQSH